MKTRRIVYCVLITAILALLFLLPIFLVIKGGFWTEEGFTFKYLLGVFRNPIYAEGLANSFAIAAGTTFLTICIALPLAWLSHKYDFKGKGFFSALILVPMILPPFVGAIGMTQILGRYGVLNAVLGTSIDWIGQARPMKPPGTPSGAAPGWERGPSQAKRPPGRSAYRFLVSDTA